MRLSHKSKVQKKMTGISGQATTVTVIRNRDSSRLICCVGVVELAALAFTAGAFYYTRNQYRISRRSELANKCLVKRPTSKALCSAQIIETKTIQIDGVDFISRVCELGHRNLIKVTKFHTNKPITK